MEFLRKRTGNLPLLQRAYEECYQSSLRAILLEARNNREDALRAWRTTKRIVSLQLSMITEAPRTEQETAIMSNILDIDRQCYDRIAFLERGGPDTNPYSSYPLYSPKEESRYDTPNDNSISNFSSSSRNNVMKNDNYHSRNTSTGNSNGYSNSYGSSGYGTSNYVNNPSSSVVDVNSSVGYTSPSYEGASSRAKTPPPLPPKVSLNLSPTRISNSFLDMNFASPTSPSYNTPTSPPAPPLHRSEYESFLDPKSRTTPSTASTPKSKPPLPSPKRPPVVRRKVSNPLDSGISVPNDSSPPLPELGTKRYNSSSSLYAPSYQPAGSQSDRFGSAESPKLFSPVPQPSPRVPVPVPSLELPEPPTEKKYQPPPLIIPATVNSSPQLPVTLSAVESDAADDRKVASMSSLAFDTRTSSMRSSGSAKNGSPPSSPVQNAPRSMLLTLRSGTKGKKVKEERKITPASSPPVLGSKKVEKTAVDPKSAIAAAQIMSQSSKKLAARPSRSSAEHLAITKPKTASATKPSSNIISPKPKQASKLAVPVPSITRPSSTPAKASPKKLVPRSTSRPASNQSTPKTTLAKPVTRPAAARSVSPVKITSTRSESPMKPVRSPILAKQPVARNASPAKSPVKTTVKPKVKHTVVKSSTASSKSGAATATPVRAGTRPKPRPASQPAPVTPEPKEEPELDENDKWMKEARAKVSNIKGIDPNAAEQIFNDVVVKGDPVVWDDIAGLEQAKTSLKETVVYPFLRPDLFSGLREPAQGMLLFGPPGTGKTMLARAVATESQSTFFSISASSLTSKFLGESEKLVRALFLMARALAPSIIFVDEIDSLLSARSENGEHETSRRIKTEFLVQWSALQHAAAGKEHEDVTRVLVLAATNLPWVIDEAARRRFVRRQYIPLPEPETRKYHLQKLLSAQKHDISPEQFDKLVAMTDGYSGSDMTALAKDAAMGPLRSLGEALLTTPRDKIRPIGFEDFVASMKTIRPSVSKEGLKVFEDWAAMYGSSGA